MMQEVWAQVQPVLITALVGILISLIGSGKRYLEGKISSDRHFKAAGIVMDSLHAATVRMGPQLIEMLKDGKLSQEEQETLKSIARGIAKERLAALKGFVLAEGGKWLEDQLDAGLGKLQALLLGITPQVDGLKEGDQDVEAST